MSKEMNEWELDWWWLDVLEGEVDRDEKREADWLLEKSSLAHKRYESWRSLKKQVQKSDWASNIQWDQSFFDKMREGIMTKIEEQFPANSTRP